MEIDVLCVCDLWVCCIKFSVDECGVCLILLLCVSLVMGECFLE